MRFIKGAAILVFLPLALLTPHTTHADVGQDLNTVSLLSGNTVSMTTSTEFPCIETGVSGTCVGVRTITAEPDPTQTHVYECVFLSTDTEKCLLPGPGPSAPSDANYYKITLAYEQAFQSADGCCRSNEYKVTQTSEDWYDANSSGNVWVNEQCAQEQANFTCDTQTHGAFWDSGYGASTDWSDQNITDHCSCGDRQSQVFLRTWVYPGGAVHFYAGH